MKTVLTIAGSDPSGGAGLQSDLATFAEFGVRGVSAVAALTAQNSTEVRSVKKVPSPFLRAQVETLLDEFTIHAVKVGMLGSSANVRALGELVSAGGLPNVVLDPVLVSTSGFPMLGSGGVEAVRKVLPLVKVLTPNVPEAESLAAIPIRNRLAMEEAARVIHGLGAANVLVTGGHLEGEPVDVLYDGAGFRRYRSGRLKGGRARFHGTGCMLSAAIAAGLANGRTVPEAVEAARDYVRTVVRSRRA